MKDKTLVYYNDKKAGTLSKTDQGYEFVYDNDYVINKEARPISKTMPLSRDRFYSERLFPFFENLLPEGFLLELTSSKLKLDKSNKFEILLNVGKDTVGAVTVKPLKK